ncbi:hypothetical protein L6164_023494 [Bauhinia variegata]|uniref:Uncharacterized protein n=1 Tax=Bauhinia variegata TaxID=167791 RepID=A0ACB9MJT2_BAUVA|nr:hypothetical protein L6164_023494 [Bauhinia variegata]
MVIDWAAGNASEKCESAKKVTNKYACKDKNSICNDTDYGYRCHCKQGYYGNPYLPDGCKDIDECADKTHNCTSNDNCRNTEGSYECFCKKWYSGKGTKEAGCQPTNLLIMVVTIVGAGFIALLVGMSTTYLVYQKRKLIKLKEKFFRQNGGSILQQALVKEDSSQSRAKIFTAEELSKATKNYDESLIVGKGGYEIATMVQGTLGYLDPEYMQTSQLTEKSDVYSFGVVLVELLTGEKAFSLVRPEEKRSLSMHFLSAFKGGCLFEILENGIVNEENKKEVMEVAELASKCLRLTGEERPSMKEVAMELEGVRKVNKHPWNSSNLALNLEGTEYLLQEKSGHYKHGDSSSHPNTGYDSIRDHVLIPLDDDGR